MPRSRSEVFDAMEVEKPSRCIKFLRLLWKFSRCIFSHVTLISLVVAYCVIGAYAFESLEATHEKEVNRSVCLIKYSVVSYVSSVRSRLEFHERRTKIARIEHSIVCSLQLTSDFSLSILSGARGLVTVSSRILKFR